MNVPSPSAVTIMVMFLDNLLERAENSLFLQPQKPVPQDIREATHTFDTRVSSVQCCNRELTALYNVVIVPFFLCAQLSQRWLLVDLASSANVHLARGIPGIFVYFSRTH